MERENSPPIPQQERRGLAAEREEFFKHLRRDTRVYPSEDYARVYSIAREQWGISSPALALPKKFFAKHPHPESLPKDIEGKILVAIDGGAVPDRDFVRYLAEHEYWELYVRVKHGLNLRAADNFDYTLPVLERTRPAHRVATLEELKLAERDGKLGNYMEWWRRFYQGDINEVSALPDAEIARIAGNYGIHDNPRQLIISRIEMNLALKEALSEKITSRREQ